MPRVYLLGQRFWATKIVTAIDDHDSDISAVFVPSSAYPRLLMSRAGADPMMLMRVGYRVGGSPWRGRAFDAYWGLLCRAKPHAARAHYWIGTDVFDTLREVRDGTIRSRVFESSRDDLHLTTFEPLSDELASVGIHSSAVAIPIDYGIEADEPTMPRQFSVLSYLPEGRFDFYGGPVLMEAARRLPDVRFDIVASDGRSVADRPPNVFWHGWVSDMAERYQQASVVVRIPRHDGGAGTVIEGLLHGRHVIWIHERPHVHQLSPVTIEGLMEQLEGLLAEHEAGRLQPNLAGRDYAREAFDEKRLGDRLAELLLDRF